MEVVSEIADRVPFFLCHSFGPLAVSWYIIVQDLDKRAHLIGIAEQPVQKKQVWVRAQDLEEVIAN
jgi:hypothetical protein